MHAITRPNSSLVKRPRTADEKESDVLAQYEDSIRRIKASTGNEDPDRDIIVKAEEGKTTETLASLNL